MEIEGQYLTYDEYVELGGSLAETSFSILEFEARQSIDKYTYGRLKDLGEQIQEVKMCIFRLMNIIDSYKELEIQNKAYSSETIDGYSLSFTTPSKATVEARRDEIKEVIKDYLVDCKLDDGTPYLYCGADVR